MKLNRQAKTKKKLATSADLKKVVASARTLFDFGLITSKRAEMIARNYK
jgi:hypothetical protein